jgi:hypothetical protein
MKKVLLSWSNVSSSNPNRLCSALHYLLAWRNEIYFWENNSHIPHITKILDPWKNCITQNDINANLQHTIINGMYLSFSLTSALMSSLHENPMLIRLHAAKPRLTAARPAVPLRPFTLQKPAAPCQRWSTGDTCRQDEAISYTPSLEQHIGQSTFDGLDRTCRGTTLIS